MAAQLRYGDPEEVGMSAGRLQAAARLAERSVADGIATGVVVLVARRGVIVLHEAWGRLTPDPDAPPLPRDAIFPLASVTKPITATAVLCLVEDGLVGLNRPAQEYLPEFVGDGKGRVLVSHLLTHTSGLREQDVEAHCRSKRGAVAVPPPAEGQHPAIAERLALGFDAPLWKAPGEEMSYCNYGFELLSEIVRRAGGRPLADFARERIFEPLGMADTHYIVPESARPRIARRYPASPPPPATAYVAHYETREWEETPWAGGGAYGTALDAAAFGQMFLQRGRYGEARVLSPSAVAAMTRNQIPGVALRLDEEFYPEATWGLGWSVRGDRRAQRAAALCSAQSFEHYGAGGTHLWVDPVHEVVGVALSLATQESSGWSSPWCADLFVDAVIAAIEV